MLMPFLPRQYKAVVLRGPGRAAIEDLRMSELHNGEILIQVAYSGVCVTDLEIAKGTLGYYQNHLAEYPIVPGHEISGIVRAVAADVHNIKSGDCVVVECIQSCGTCERCFRDLPIACPDRAEMGVIRKDGGYAEFVTAPARFAHRIPPSIDLQSACLIEPLAVVLKGLGRLWQAQGHRASWQRCAVIGAGPLGRLCALALSHYGHAVTIFDCDERRLSGIELPIRTAFALDDLSDFDVLVEATGQQQPLESVLRESRAGAAILCLGLPYAPAVFSFEQIVAYDKTIVGSVGSGPCDFAGALKLLPKLDTSGFTDTVLPLEDFRTGWDLAASRSALKVLFAVNRLNA